MSVVTKDGRDFIYVGGVKAGRVVNGRFEVCGKPNSKVRSGQRKRPNDVNRIRTKATVTEIAIAMSTGACSS